MNRLRISGVLISALVLLAACGAPVPPAPTPTSTPPLINVTIEYLYGGSWGFWREMTITSNGAASLNDGVKAVGTLKLPPDRITDLLRLFEEADFYNLKENYEDKDHIISDDNYSTLTLTQGDRTKSVTVAMARGSDLAPKALMDLIVELQKTAEEIEKSATPSP